LSLSIPPISAAHIRASRWFTKLEVVYASHLLKKNFKVNSYFSQTRQKNIVPRNKIWYPIKKTVLFQNLCP
jgi:hypothetical protein